MAEAVLFNIADGVIAKLGSVILQEIGLWWGVKEELDKLNGTVSTIKTVLLHAEEQSLETPPVKYWLGRLKEAIYDADDLLDEFSTEASRQQMMTGNRISKEVRLLCSGSNKFAYGLKMAHKIKDMSNKLEKIAADRRFLLEERPRETLNVSRGSREQTHSSAPDVVVGREHDKEAIIELLLSSINEDNVSVIPIIGIGGLGKTTLAQCVYNDERVKTHFELKAWACISDNFEVQKTVRKIIESASGKNPEISEMEALKNLLHDRINGKKFLIVLDDLWSDDTHKWFRLKDLLAGGASGSKIVITTRLRKVAEMTRPVSIHELEGLSEIESWSLFKQIAFKRGQLPSPSHEAIGKEIVAKCKGAPLAIRTIAGILYFKDAESEWEAFKNKELSKVDQGENDILPTLRLSYNYLPSHYKHCFAYCSLYPKDCNIKVEELIQCWIAQGYVKSSEDANHCLQDIGAEYFTDLFQRSFFQEVKKDTYGNIYTCKMHDLMHDLAVSVAGEDCDLLNSEMACTISDKTLHISLKLDGNFRLQAFPSLLKANKLRSLLLKALVLRVPNIKEEEIHVLFCSLRCLRVLDLSDLGIKSVPCSIYKLRHLRYLNLSKNRPIKTLPDSITKLQNLQVLNLQECASLKQLPKDIEKLVNLWHLNIDGCYGLSHMPRGIGKLTCLQKLSKYFVAEDNFFKNLSWQSAGLGELNALNNLRGGLMIENLRCVKNAAFECKAANLKEKQHLQRLKLDWSRYGHGDDREKDETTLEALQPHQNLKQLMLWSYWGVKSPSWLSSLINLVSIEICDCKNMQLLHLPAFDRLASLKYLRIYKLINLEHIETEVHLDDSGSASFYPSLANLNISLCPKLKGFMRCKTDVGMTLASSSSLRISCLRNLYIGSSPNLISMPHFPALEELILGKDCLKALKNILEMAIPVSQFPSSLSPSTAPFSALSQLKQLKIQDEINDLSDLQLLQNLTNLQCLEFSDSQTVKTLYSDENDDGMQWQGLKSLHSFKVNNMPNLESLPKGLLYVTTLHSLDIYCCHSMKSLPEWMANLTSLQYLSISFCPQLAERCKTNVAEDWSKIAHIPDISINYERIQRNGLYQL